MNITWDPWKYLGPVAVFFLTAYFKKRQTKNKTGEAVLADLKAR